MDSAADGLSTVVKFGCQHETLESPSPFHRYGCCCLTKADFGSVGEKWSWFHEPPNAYLVGVSEPVWEVRWFSRSGCAFGVAAVRDHWFSGPDGLPPKMVRSPPKLPVSNFTLFNLPNVLDKRAAQTSELRTSKGWTKI